MKKLSQNELTRLFKKHEEWVNSLGETGQRLETRDGFDLSGLDLSGLNLVEAVLPLSNFDRSKLVQVDLYGSHLALSSFIEADMTEIILIKANLSRAKLVRSVLRNANLFRAHFYTADLRQADLTGADLSHTFFSECNLRGAVLRDAKFERKTSFNESQLAGVDLRGVQGTENILSIGWIDIGPEGDPIILEGDEMLAWLIQQTKISK